MNRKSIGSQWMMRAGYSQRQRNREKCGVICVDRFWHKISQKSSVSIVIGIVNMPGADAMKKGEQVLCPIKNTRLVGPGQLYALLTYSASIAMQAWRTATPTAWTTTSWHCQPSPSLLIALDAADAVLTLDDLGPVLQSSTVKYREIPKFQILCSLPTYKFDSARVL